MTIILIDQRKQRNWGSNQSNDANKFTTELIRENKENDDHIDWSNDEQKLRIKSIKWCGEIDDEIGALKWGKWPSNCLHEIKSIKSTKGYGKNWQWIDQMKGYWWSHRWKDIKIESKIFVRNWRHRRNRRNWRLKRSTIQNSSLWICKNNW